jgi:hypothetical protein
MPIDKTDCVDTWIVDRNIIHKVDSFIAGSVAGLVSVGFGHSIDTIKCNQQVGKKMVWSVPYLFRGLGAAMNTAVLTNTLCFGLSDNLESYTNSHYISGFITGCVNSIITNPLEYRKIQFQVLGHCGTDYFRGLGACLLRESFSWSIYFGTYHNLREQNVHPAIAGCIVGPLSWLPTYPIDVIKTKIQSESTSYKKIVRSLSLKESTRGLTYCLVRAFVVNAVTFPVYEATLDYIKVS